MRQREVAGVAGVQELQNGELFDKRYSFPDLENSASELLNSCNS
jgi:hypothetical protein